jgi:hypothetical protein
LKGIGVERRGIVVIKAVLGDIVSIGHHGAAKMGTGCDIVLMLYPGPILRNERLLIAQKRVEQNIESLDQQHDRARRMF